MAFLRNLINREYQSNVAKTYDFAVKRVRRSFVALNDHDAERDFWTSPVFSSHFCPLESHSSLLAAANEFGQVILWDMKRNMYMAHHGVTDAHDNAVFDLAWAPKDLKIITASGDKSVGMWDCVADCLINRVRTFNGHTATVKSCSWNPQDNSVFSSGDRSGTVIIWDARTQKPENVINCAHERERFWRTGKKPQIESASVTGIIFYEPYYMITAAAGTPNIRMWDLRKYYAAYSKKPQPVHELSHGREEDQSGYTYLIIDPVRHRLYATSVYDRIYAFALNTSQFITAAVLAGSIVRSFYAKSSLSPDGNYLISGSSTEEAVIWNTNESSGKDVLPIRKLLTSGYEVNTVAWCRSPGASLKIATFPECTPCEVYDINPDNISMDLQDCYFLSECCDDEDVSETESGLPSGSKRSKKLRSLAVTQFKPGRPDMGSPVRGSLTQSNLINSAEQMNKKRVLHEILDNDSEDRQNKKIKLRVTLSPQRVLICSDSPGAEGKDDKTPVTSHSINRCDINEKDLFSCASTSQLLQYGQDFTRNVGHVTVSDSVTKTPFSPTSNLPNHVVDGTSPSHVCRTYRKKRVDWLTELRYGKMPDLENRHNKLIIERKNELSRKPRRKQHESILRFFRVLGKGTDDLKSSKSVE